MKLSSRRIFCGVLLVVAGFGVGPLRAVDLPDANGITSPSIATSLPNNGDPGGVRKWLSQRGITYNVIYTNDVLSNLSGGNKRGTIDQGKLEGQMTVDLAKLADWQDLTFYANAFQIHNTGRIRRDYVGGMNTIAAIEATPATRLSELWLERKFIGGAASFRVGQLAADSEFFFSDLSNMFMQTDWPTIAAVNVPGGGPAYPLSTPGVDPAFIIGEAQFRSNQGKDDTGLARALKLGGWSHLGQFADQRYANDGTLLADPVGSGIPAQHRGDFGIYGIIDQQIYRPRGGAADSGISMFSRASMSPSDRNLVDLQVDAGIVFAGLIPNRPDDRFGGSAIYARFSDSARAFDQDQINFGLPGTVRDYEANLELSYVAQIIPGWTVQPDFQYIWHPSGFAGRDAKVLGVRSMWKF